MKQYQLTIDNSRQIFATSVTFPGPIFREWGWQFLSDDPETHAKLLKWLERLHLHFRYSILCKLRFALLSSISNLNSNKYLNCLTMRTFWDNFSLNWHSSLLAISRNVIIPFRPRSLSPCYVIPDMSLLSNPVSQKWH